MCFQLDIVPPTPWCTPTLWSVFSSSKNVHLPNRLLPPTKRSKDAYYSHQVLINGYLLHFANTHKRRYWYIALAIFIHILLSFVLALTWVSKRLSLGWISSAITDLWSLKTWNKCPRHIWLPTSFGKARPLLLLEFFWATCICIKMKKVYKWGHQQKLLVWDESLDQQGKIYSRRQCQGGCYSD